MVRSICGVYFHAGGYPISGQAWRFGSNQRPVRKWVQWLASCVSNRQKASTISRKAREDDGRRTIRDKGDGRLGADVGTLSSASSGKSGRRAARSRRRWEAADHWGPIGAIGMGWIGLIREIGVVWVLGWRPTSRDWGLGVGRRGRRAAPHLILSFEAWAARFVHAYT